LFHSVPGQAPCSPRRNYPQTLSLLELHACPQIPSCSSLPSATVFTSYSQPRLAYSLQNSVTHRGCGSCNGLAAARCGFAAGEEQRRTQQDPHQLKSHKKQTHTQQSVESETALTLWHTQACRSVTYLGRVLAIFLCRCFARDLNCISPSDKLLREPHYLLTWGDSPLCGWETSYVWWLRNVHSSMYLSENT
jgi:hypothetical protein